MTQKVKPQQIAGITVEKRTKADLISTGFEFGIDVRNVEYLKFSRSILNFELLGGVNIRQLDRLRVTLKISRSPLLTPLHTFRNTVDLYNDNQVERYIRQAAEKLELGTGEIKLPLYELIESLEKYRIAKRSEQIAPQQAPKIVLTPKEKNITLKFLKDANLLPKIGALLAKMGLIGEKDNGLLLFLIFLTRNFEYPLHAIVHGSSGSGKTNLMKTVIATVPNESKHLTTALTENVLFYPPFKNFWQRKILMLEDLDGSLKALLPLREFMSNQSITKFITEMDVQSGEHRQKKLEAKGPICIVGATTKEKIYEDNSNRSFLIYVDESKLQQKAVMNYQNKLAAGIINLSEVEEIKHFMQNLQRLLDPITIKNPFQPDLELPDSVFKPLRTNQHYIQLIKAVTFLHQHQRPVEKDENGKRYITTTLSDIEWANKLSKESLLRKSDELNGKQRFFFEALKKYLKTQGINAKENKSFYAKDYRKAFKAHPEQLKRNFLKLEAHGYITQVSNSKKQGYEYQIVLWDDYENLRKGINILDEKLALLKETYPDA